ncbi:sporulation protein Cse60 [Lysinibacillus tabacifolii]|uniref:Sporulation protein Cse60 n=1 Tax=Lysinibacillus tabacifolii TaxID=1173107 RepID=A0ABY2T3H0_9BACI|nr:sporulation protein Cse60 [Lysinibacillus tabacifolii]TKI50580.1 sporulation protein Cse60 [Lysinibacillus tabacifolii]
MTKIKVIDSRKKDDFENKVNEYLKELQNHEIIDIKYSASVVNSLGLPLIYSAMIIYK